jgi:hypothetical protein
MAVPIISDTKTVWIPWVNTDLTEGRGLPKPLCICETEYTAMRLGKKQNVMGSDANVIKELAVEINHRWYAPCYICPSSREDEEKSEKLEIKRQAIAKATSLGLSDKEIGAITGNYDS